jgi:murein DD-endopeptidase MepM/ murein hydrolase activator NlpD
MVINLSTFSFSISLSTHLRCNTHMMLFHTQLIHSRARTVLMTVAVFLIALGFHGIPASQTSMGASVAPPVTHTPQICRMSEESHRTHTSQYFGCTVRLTWPIRNAQGQPARRVSNRARIPLQNWFPGHRGIDIQAGADSYVVAPADGTIHFAGKVGGKDVVSISLTSIDSAASNSVGRMVMTFEPARTQLKKGDQIHEGQRVASIEGVSDHCAEGYIHVGVLRDGVYVDPLTVLIPSHIVLKPN